MLYNGGMKLFGCSARSWGVFFLLASFAGCSVDQVVHEGRPCESDEQCAGGTLCDPTSKTCQRPGAGDAGQDLPATDGKASTPDKRPPDQEPAPDQLVAPDGGCPKGTVRCGAVCADLKTNPKHCGKCNSGCPPLEGATCINGLCHCGKGPICSKGLTCVNKLCRCVPGVMCKGCCDGDVCRGTLSASKCGAGGEKCASCVDTNPCTLDSCSAAGKCVHANKTSSCDDKDPCTINDKCLSGKCKGQVKNCSDGLTCTSDSCGKAGCLSKVNPGYCAINKACYVSGAKHPASSCLSCVPSASTSSWTAAKGCVSTLAGTGTSGCKNGLASTATLNGPFGVAVDAAGRVYVTEVSNHVVRTIYKGQVSVLAGTCKKSGSADGPAATATFNNPYDVVVDTAGNVYVADNGNHRIRKISGGKVTTYAGSSKGFADGSALSAKFDSPQSLVITPSGILYVLDTVNNRVRKISGGKVTTYAGSGASGSVDGARLSATFSWPHSMAMDSLGNLYVSETYWIRKVTSTQVSTLIKPTAGCSGLHSIQGLAAASPSKLYIGDYGGQRIRVYASGVLSTLTGQCQVKGSTDGLLSKALFNMPADLFLAGGKLYVADYINHKIRIISLP